MVMKEDEAGTKEHRNRPEVGGGVLRGITANRSEIGKGS